MRGKLFGFVTALLAVATIGVVQLQTHAAQPGQVGSAPRCTVTATGSSRATAFHVNGSTARVNFKVTGPENCKVQLSTNSFYAPSMNGRPYSKQILFDRNTKVFKTGTYSMNVKVPTQSTKQKGCYYQLDLTYGTHNVTPVLAYAHGRVSCKKPVAMCDSLNVQKITRTKFSLTGRASATGGASIKSYTFKVLKDGKVVQTRTIKTAKDKASTTIVRIVPGTYKVRLSVATSEGARTSANCVGTFTVEPKPYTPLDVQVCNPETGEIITVKEDQAGNYVPVGDPACEDVTVCELETGKTVTIRESDFDSNKYSYDEADCEDTPVVEVKELPQTGAADVVVKLAGAVSLAAAGTYYWLSRRNA